MLVKENELEKAVERLNQEYGWKLNASDCWLGSDSCVYFQEQPESVMGYTVCIDPETGKSCRRGNGEGCFWTDWE